VGKPRNGRDFDSCEGDVGEVSGKNGQKLCIVSGIFASVLVFSSIQLVPA